MTASERLRELWEPARAYIERKELGNENVIAANTFVDTLVDAAPLLIACLEAAEAALAAPEYDWPYEPGANLDAAVVALREHLEGSGGEAPAFTTEELMDMEAQASPEHLEGGEAT